MAQLYRLEFNEQQQKFHLDFDSHEENTHGCFTIFEYCTDLEFRIYGAYVNRIKKEKLTKTYLLRCADEVKSFMSNLTEYKLNISKI